MAMDACFYLPGLKSDCIVRQIHQKVKAVSEDSFHVGTVREGLLALLNLLRSAGISDLEDKRKIDAKTHWNLPGRD